MSGPDPSLLGEGCWLLPFSGGPSGPTSQRILATHRRLLLARDAGALPVLDLVPGLGSLGVHFDPAAEDAGDVLRRIERLLAAPAPDEVEREPASHTLPTRFDGPDLPAVAEAAGMDEAGVVEAFTAPTYAIAAVGFLPHFPYLLGLNPRLTTPRRASPRTRVPAGSVAIGNDQAGVYPRESPGGWNLIGAADPARLESIRPGDAVRFEEAR